MNNDYLVKQSTLSDIANSIREKTGSTEPITVNEMSFAIASISGGTNFPFQVTGNCGWSNTILIEAPELAWSNIIDPGASTYKYIVPENTNAVLFLRSQEECLSNSAVMLKNHANAFDETVFGTAEIRDKDNDGACLIIYNLLDPETVYIIPL